MWTFLEEPKIESKKEKQTESPVSEEVAPLLSAAQCVYRYALDVTMSSAEAEDAVQLEAFTGRRTERIRMCSKRRSRLAPPGTGPHPRDLPVRVEFWIQCPPGQMKFFAGVRWGEEKGAAATYGNLLRATADRLLERET